MAHNTSATLTIDAKEKKSLITNLDDNFEAVRFCSAFTLALAGEIQVLVTRLNHKGTSCAHHCSLEFSTFVL